MMRRFLPRPEGRGIRAGDLVNAVRGIQCRDVNGLTLSDVSGSVEKEPLLSYENVQGLDAVNVNLEKVTS
jgi:hypothetical protein